MSAAPVQLAARAALSPNGTSNPYIAARQDLFNKLYPPVGPAFGDRIRGFHALGAL